MIDKLIKIQAELKVPKTRENKFGKYMYRNAEDILEAAKPLCHAEGFTLVIQDDVVEVGGRVYVKATAMLTCKEGNVSAMGWAREAEKQAGMADAQITGATSSYARKYALNGLFALDDVQDADATNTHGKENKDVARDIPVGDDELDLD